MTTTSTPSPAIMGRFAPRAAAVIPPELPVEGNDEAAGVVRTKHLKCGMRATPWFNGAAHGSERIIESVQPANEDRSMWKVTFLSPHAPQTEKAAYRWYVPGSAPFTQTIEQAITTKEQA